VSRVSDFVDAVHCVTMLVIVRTLLSLLMLVVVTPTSAQRTYQRHCDCEYWVNGKCAYTLLVPATSNGDMTCPLANSSASLSRLQDDVSALQTWTGEQAKAVVMLQNSINALMAAVRRLETADGTRRPATDTSNSSQSAAALDDIKTAVDQLNRTVVRLTALCRGRCSDDTSATSSSLERQLVSKYQLCAVRGLIVSTVNNSAITASSVNESVSTSDVRINSTSDDNNSGGWCPSQSGELLLLSHFCATF